MLILTSFLMRFPPAFGNGLLHVVISVLVEILHQIHQTCIWICWLLLTGFRCFSYFVLFLLQYVCPICTRLILLQGDCDTVRFDLHVAVTHVDVFEKRFKSKPVVLAIEVSDFQVNWVVFVLYLNIVLVMFPYFVKTRKQIHFDQVFLLVPAIVCHCNPV